MSWTCLKNQGSCHFPKDKICSVGSGASWAEHLLGVSCLTVCFELAVNANQKENHYCDCGCAPDLTHTTGAMVNKTTHFDGPCQVAGV